MRACLCSAARYFSCVLSSRQWYSAESSADANLCSPKMSARSSTDPALKLTFSVAGGPADHVSGQ